MTGNNFSIIYITSIGSVAIKPVFIIAIYQMKGENLSVVMEAWKAHRRRDGADTYQYGQTPFCWHSLVCKLVQSCLLLWQVAYCPSCLWELVAAVGSSCQCRHLRRNSPGQGGRCLSKPCVQHQGGTEAGGLPGWLTLGARTHQNTLAFLHDVSVSLTFKKKAGCVFCLPLNH